MLNIQTGLAVNRCITGSQQQHVSLAQRHVEHVRQGEEHFPTWRCSASFEKADVASGNLGFQREFELAQVTRFSPATEQRSDAVRLYDHSIPLYIHAKDSISPAYAEPLPRR
jgi:hypothetical protein